VNRGEDTGEDTGEEVMLEMGEMDRKLILAMSFASKKKTQIKGMPFKMILPDAKEAGTRHASRVYTSPHDIETSPMSNEYFKIASSMFGGFHVHDFVRKGKGTYGTAYRLTNITPHMRTEFAKYFSHLAHSKGDPATLPNTVIVKFILFPRGDVSQRHLSIFSGVLREIDAQWDLSRAEPVTVGGKTFDASSVVPKLYAAGYDRKSRVGIMVMEELKGEMFGSHGRETMPAWYVAKLEYAMACLYLNDYLHMDLHNGNVMVDPAKKTVRILDFGLAAKIPGTAAIFKSYLMHYKEKAIDEFWNAYGDPRGNSVVHHRKNLYGTTTKWFRNITILQRARTFVDQAELERERSKTWVISPPPPPPPPQHSQSSSAEEGEIKSDDENSNSMPLMKKARLLQELQRRHNQQK